jgi:hypothetical protein
VGGLAEQDPAAVAEAVPDAAAAYDAADDAAAAYDAEENTEENTNAERRKNWREGLEGGGGNIDGAATTAAADEANTPSEEFAAFAITGLDVDADALLLSKAEADRSANVADADKSEGDPPFAMSGLDSTNIDSAGAEKDQEEDKGKVKEQEQKQEQIREQEQKQEEWDSGQDNDGPIDMSAVAEAIDQLVADIAPAKFAQSSQLLLDLVQGLGALQTMAETGKLLPSAASAATTTIAPPAAALPPSAETTPPMRYPTSLVGSISKHSPAGRARLEQLLDTPHAVSCHRGGWFSVHLRRKKGELAAFRARREAKGRDAVSIGRAVRMSRAGSTAKYRRQTRGEVPMSAEGEEGKYVCDLRMALDIFCNIFHSSCPEHNLIDAFQRGRVRALFFGDGDQTAAETVQYLENYFLKKVRCGQLDNIIDARIRRRRRSSGSSSEPSNSVHAALSAIFTNVIGDKLKSVGFWSVVTERVRCTVQFQIEDTTVLTPRRPVKVRNDSEVRRIRRFRRHGGALGQAASEILNPKPIPTNLVKREADMEAIVAYNTSLKGRRRRVSQQNQTKVLRHEEIEEVCWVVLTGFDAARKQACAQALVVHAKMSLDDAEWALKWGVPYYLLRQDNPDLSLAEGNALKEALEAGGCEVVLERQQLNAI